jgi:hypothetical protein
VETLEDIGVGKDFLIELQKYRKQKQKLGNGITSTTKLQDIKVNNQQCI